MIYLLEIVAYMVDGKTHAVDKKQRKGALGYAQNKIGKSLGIRFPEEEV